MAWMGVQMTRRDYVVAGCAAAPGEGAPVCWSDNYRLIPG